MISETESKISDRITTIESILGIKQFKTLPTETSDISDIVTKINDLYIEHLKQIESHQFKNSSLWSDLQICEKLEKEFNPGLSLTNQIQSSSSKNAPLLYRRQQILSNQKSFQYHLQSLTVIQNLLSRQKTSGSMDSVLLSSKDFDVAADPEMIQRLNDLSLKSLDIQSRTSKLTSRLDALVNRYHQIISATSEKMVLADEELHQMEMEKDQKGSN